MSNLETLKKQTADLEAKLEEMKAEIERLENGWEMKYPYKYSDDVYALSSDGETIKDHWACCDYDKNRFAQGNTFLTEEAALLESKRRNLLTRFRAFRDECNGDWKPEWTENTYKWSVYFNVDHKMFFVGSSFIQNDFCLFGYFKNREHAERAIELFGDEIKELFVEGE